MRETMGFMTSKVRKDKYARKNFLTYKSKINLDSIYFDAFTAGQFVLAAFNKLS